MEGVGIAYLFCALLYLVACIMDGPDVKHLWKKWLGLKLADAALHFYPIHYCKIEHCIYPKKCREASDEIADLKKCIDSFLSMRNRPLEVTKYDMVKIESEPYLISEDQLFRAHRMQHEAKIRGEEFLLPYHETVDGLISLAKESVVRNILQTIKNGEFVQINVDDTSRYPEIIVNGFAYVGNKTKDN